MIDRLSPGEVKLLKIFQEDYGDRLGNAGCNDLTDEMKNCLTPEEWQALDQEYHKFNGDPEETGGYIYMMDFMVLYYLQKKMGIK